jgi:hypothetical protein
MNVPSVCTIVKTIEWVGPAYGQRNSVVGSSRQKQRQHTKRLVKDARKLNRICKASVRPNSLGINPFYRLQAQS